MRSRKSDVLVFVKEVLRDFKGMGAVLPSSRFVARSIVQEVPTNDNGIILELGAGTGVISAALLQHGFAPQDIVLVETSFALSEHLKQRFPSVMVVNGDACHLDKLLADNPRTVRAIISSLPLRTLSKEVRRTIGEQVSNILAKGGVYIQFTYSCFTGKTCFPDTLHHLYTKRVWRNLLPSRVDVFCHRNSLAANKSVAA